MKIKLQLQMRYVLAVIGGIIAAVVIIFIVEAASYMFFPPPKGIDMENPEDVKRLIASAPVGSMIMVVVGWAIGAFVGGLVASVISVRHKSAMALTVGLLLMISGIINLYMFPHPLWMWIIGLAVNIPFAYFGFKFADRNYVPDGVSKS